MTINSSTTRKKDLGQPGNGGQFAGKGYEEPGVSIGAPAPDMSWWDEDARGYPASLYQAGVDGTLEPYNGDYPVKDGALRFWREDMDRELVIGEVEDGTTVVAVEAEPDEDIYVSVNAGTDPTPAAIKTAIDVVRERASRLPPRAED